MYTQTSALDAAQATNLLGRIMELSTAATTAATTANQMLEAFNSGGGKGAAGVSNSSTGSLSVWKVLRPDEGRRAAGNNDRDGHFGGTCAGVGHETVLHLVLALARTCLADCEGPFFSEVDLQSVIG